MFSNILSTISDSSQTCIHSLCEWNDLIAADRLRAAMSQSIQFNVALRAVDQCFKEFNIPPLSSRVKFCITKSPYLSAWLTYKNIEPLFFKETLCTISNWHGKIARTIYFIAFTSFAFYSQPVLIPAALGSYTLTYMYYQGYFGERLKKIVYIAFIFPLKIHAILQNDVFTKGLLVLWLLPEVIKGIRIYWPNKQQNDDSYIAAQAISFENTFSRTDLFSAIEVDKSHVHKKITFATDDLSIDLFNQKLIKFKSFFDRIDWDNNNLTALFRKLNSDLHWNNLEIVGQDLYKKISELSKLFQIERLNKDQESRKMELMKELKPYAISFVKEGFDILAERLFKQMALTQEQSYEPKQWSESSVRKKISMIDLSNIHPDSFKQAITHYFKIFDYLHKNSDEETIAADSFMRLGIEIGDYCNPQVLEVLEDIAQGFTSVEDSKTSLEEMILLILKQYRIYHVKNLFGKIIKFLPGSLVEQLGLNSPHQTNYFLEIYNDEIGTGTNASKDDIDAKTSSDEASNLLYPFIWKESKNFFYHHYNVGQILDYLKDEIKNSKNRISKVEIQNWFQKTFSLPLSDLHSLWKEDYTMFNDRALCLLLLKIGVFKIKK